MALDPKAQAALALHRFGFGPRAGSVAAIAADPRGALLAELDRPGAGLITDPDLPTSGAAARTAFEFQQARTGGTARPSAPRKRPIRRPPTPCRPARRPSRPSRRRRHRNSPSGPIPIPIRARRSSSISSEAKARIDAALGAEIGFVERLVWFWSNHFCVSADKGTCAMAGAYEREAIRAACARPLRRHAARRRKPSGDAVLSRQCALDRPELGRRHQPQTRGLNENLAREILELHTLGVRTRLHPGRRHQLRQGAHRLDDRADRDQSRCTAASSSSIRACTSRARRRCSARAIRKPASSRAARCSPISRAHPATAKHVAHQARAPFRRRRAAAGAGRAAGQALPRHRRRSQGGGEGAGRRARSLGRAAQQAQAAGRMDRRGAARHRRHAARHPRA